MQDAHRLKVDCDRCTACRACELACHFHHQGNFATAASSIGISFNPDSAEIQITFSDTCDSCRHEHRPYCVQFCGPGAINLVQETGSIPEPPLLK
jgi:Fe-S-cluster-containing dehydrogenase component